MTIPAMSVCSSFRTRRETRFLSLSFLAIRCRCGWRDVVFAALLIGVCAAARAHDTSEITTRVQIGAHGMALIVTMARPTAMSTVTGERSRGFDPAQFAERRAVLVAGAPSIFELRGGRGLLGLRSSRVELGMENDVDFHLSYPHPGRGPLRLTAIHLAPLGPGFGNIVTVQDVDGALLGQKMLAGGDDALDVQVPSDAVTPSGAAGVVTVRRRYEAILAVAIATGAWWFYRRSMFRKSR
jgi:hypothetical protein